MIQHHPQKFLKDAKKKNPDAKIGDFQSTVLPPIDLVRIAAQTAKQVIVQKVREVERKKCGQPGARKNFQFSKR